MNKVYRVFTVSLIACLLGLNTVDAQTTFNDSCWEKCFQTAGTENFTYSEFYNEFLEMAMYIAEMKNLHNINKIGFLIDSSLSDRHNNLTNDPLGRNLENGTDIFQFQVLIAQALGFIVNGVRTTIVQYDEAGAWSCDKFTCLNPCQNALILQKQRPVLMGPTSHCPGNIESACRLLNTELIDYACVGFNQVAMAVAITNGDFFLNDPFDHSSTLDMLGHIDDICPPYSVDSSSSRSSGDEGPATFFSFCHSFFDTRFVIATNSARDKVQKKFASKHGHYKFLTANAFTLHAMTQLVNCLNDPVNGCCFGVIISNATITPKQCLATTGPRGEFIVPYPAHPALQGGTLAG